MVNFFYECFIFILGKAVPSQLFREPLLTERMVKVQLNTGQFNNRMKQTALTLNSISCQKIVELYLLRSLLSKESCSMTTSLFPRLKLPTLIQSEMLFITKMIATYCNLCCLPELSLISILLSWESMVSEFLETTLKPTSPVLKSPKLFSSSLKGS